MSRTPTSRGRYGKLRPHKDSILQWCLEGRQWVEMADLLRDMGVKVTPAAINTLCNREGYVCVHQYSTHYDPAIREKLKAGNITASELKLTKQIKTQP